MRETINPDENRSWAHPQLVLDLISLRGLCLHCTSVDRRYLLWNRRSFIFVSLGRAEQGGLAILIREPLGDAYNRSTFVATAQDLHISPPTSQLPPVFPFNHPHPVCLFEQLIRCLAFAAVGCQFQAYYHEDGRLAGPSAHLPTRRARSLSCSPP